MGRWSRQASCAFVFGISFLVPARAADPQWIRARLGFFESISDRGRKAAIQGLSQFEQFRYALGAVMGQADLKLEPPLRILIFGKAQEMAAQGCKGLMAARARTMACVPAEGQLPAKIIRELPRRLLGE